MYLVISNAILFLKLSDANPQEGQKQFGGWQPVQKEAEAKYSGQNLIYQSKFLSNQRKSIQAKGIRFSRPV
jgi:hypothetical protein